MRLVRLEEEFIAQLGLVITATHFLSIASHRWGSALQKKEETSRDVKAFSWTALVGILAIAVIGTSAATGESEASKARAQVLRLSIGAEPPSLDPGLATDTTSSNLISNIMDPLIKLGPAPGLRALPSAAESWTVAARR